MEPKAWAYPFINGGLALALSSIGVFFPTFIHEFGYTAARAQLFSVIPYSCGFVCLPIVVIINDCKNTKATFYMALCPFQPLGTSFL